MALTPEEKTELFETITNGEEIQERALAIARLQDEYEELETIKEETTNAFTELQQDYVTTQQAMKELLSTRSVVEVNKDKDADGKNKSEDDQSERRYGFAKFAR